MAWGIIDEPLPLMRKETGVLIVMVHVMLPYAVLTLYPNMRGIDVRLVAAELLGGGKVLMVAEYVAVQLNDTLRWGLGTMLAATLMLSVLAALWALPRVVDVKRLFGA